MRVTVCQLRNDDDGLDADLQALSSHVRERGSDLLLLPEMGLGPWLAATRDVDPAAWEAAMAAHEQRLGRLDVGATVVAGTRPVLTRGEPRNRAYVRATDGALEDGHEKHHLPDEAFYWEASWYRPGDGPGETFTIAGARAGLVICTEMWFFQHARRFGQEGAQLLLVPRATPHRTQERWLFGGRSAAVVSGTYCLSSNPYLPYGAAADLAGVGWVIDPEGRVLATTSPEVPFATVDLDLAAADQAKTTYPRYVND